MKAAAYARTLEDGTVVCELCPHRCRLAEGADGRCRVRGVRDGRLMALGYGRVSSLSLDPIEKKPLYHYQPGRPILSVGGWGCNFACRFCQNWRISQNGAPEAATVLRPDELVAEACRCREERGSIGLAYTYNEPLVGFEYVRDSARLAHAAGLVNVLVTNGSVLPAPARALLPLIDALNIDIKSMDPAFYRRYAGGELEPVLRFAALAREAGRHVEITNLVIPGLNDGADRAARLATWIAAHLGSATPLHLSAYRPEHRLDIPATPPRLLGEARAACTTALAYVYLGNVTGGEGQDTCCRACAKRLVRRRGYVVSVDGLAGRNCAACGAASDILVPSAEAGEGAQGMSSVSANGSVVKAR